MEFVESNELLVKIDRAHYWLYIDEYKTIWSCSCKQLGHALCSATDWRYKKKEFKTIEQVKGQFIKDIKKAKVGGYL